MKKKILLALILFFIGFFIADSFRYKSALEKPFTEKNAGMQTVIIKKGSSAKSIGELLEEKKLIGKSRYFKRYAEDIDAEKKLLSGRFELTAGMTIPEMVEIMTDAKKAKNFITIPEGFTARQIDETLTEMNLIKKDEFIDAIKNFKGYEKFPFLKKDILQNRTIPLEGYLFPDTYFLDTGNFSNETFIEMMLNNFEKRIKEKNISAEKFEALDQMVVVASLLEKEVKTEKDLAAVAGIIWKRKENGWFLNIDAAALYENHIYDTYKEKGLPEGPIGNPGIKTLFAAFRPESSPYWFYITKPETGEVIYAKTNDEQNENRRKYLH